MPCRLALYRRRQPQCWLFKFKTVVNTTYTNWKGLLYPCKCLVLSLKMHPRLFVKVMKCIKLSNFCNLRTILSIARFLQDFGICWLSSGVSFYWWKFQHLNRLNNRKNLLLACKLTCLFFLLTCQLTESSLWLTSELTQSN